MLKILAWIIKKVSRVCFHLVSLLPLCKWQKAPRLSWKKLFFPPSQFCFPANNGQLRVSIEETSLSSREKQLSLASVESFFHENVAENSGCHVATVVLSLRHYLCSSTYSRVRFGFVHALPIRTRAEKTWFIKDQLQDLQAVRDNLTLAKGRRKWEEFGGWAKKKKKSQFRVMSSQVDPRELSFWPDWGLFSSPLRVVNILTKSSGHIIGSGLGRKLAEITQMNEPVFGKKKK